MEYLSRVLAEGLESQEFTYPDEYTRCQGLHNFYFIYHAEEKIFDKPSFFEKYTLFSFLYQKTKNYD